MNSGYSTTPRIQRLKLFCLKVLNIVSHVDNFQRLSLPTSWTGLLPSVKRPPCQKVVIWKFLTLYRQSNNAVGLRLFLEMGISITAYPVPRAPPAPLTTSALGAPCATGDFDMLLKSDSISRAPVAGASNIVQNCPKLSQISPLRSNIATNRPKSPFKWSFLQLGPIMGSKMFINDFIGLKNDTNRPIEYSTY